MTKSPAQLDREVAEILETPRASLATSVGQIFDRLGQVYEVTKIGRDKARTVQIARRVRDSFGKETLIDHYSFPMRNLEREYMKPIDPQVAARRGYPSLVR